MEERESRVTVDFFFGSHRVSAEVHFGFSV